MAVYRNKNKLWSIRGTYKNSEGKYVSYKRFNGAKGFSLKKDAEKADAEFRESVEMSNIDEVPKSLLTLKQGFDLYIEDKKTQLKQSTLETNIDTMKLFSHLYDYKITSITSSMLNKELKRMDESGYSVNYIDKCYSVLNKLYKWFLKEKMIKYNPMDEVDRIKRPNTLNENDSKNNFWTLEEFELFIEAVEDKLYFSMFNFYYWTGCRRGEVLAMKWSDINFKNQTFSVDKTCFFPKGGGYKLTPPKNKNAIRIRKMPDRLIKIMKEWHDVQKNIYGFKDDYFIFGATKPIARTTLATHFNDPIKKLKLKKITIHGLRHSHVSYLANKGINLHDVAYRIGDTVQVVQDTYWHFFPERENAMMDLIG
jgi:integrase